MTGIRYFDLQLLRHKASNHIFQYTYGPEQDCRVQDCPVRLALEFLTAVVSPTQAAKAQKSALEAP